MAGVVTITAAVGVTGKYLFGVVACELITLDA
jgi:hypothetical protein